MFFVAFKLVGGGHFHPRLDNDLILQQVASRINEMPFFISLIEANCISVDELALSLLTHVAFISPSARVLRPRMRASLQKNLFVSIIFGRTLLQEIQFILFFLKKKIIFELYISVRDRGMANFSSESFVPVSQCLVLTNKTFLSLFSESLMI